MRIDLNKLDGTWQTPKTEVRDYDVKVFVPNAQRRRSYKTVDNESGLTWIVRIDDCLVHDKNEPMVEFYDARYDFVELDIAGKPESGQFVTRYSAETIYRSACTGTGINLHGGVDSWSVSAELVMEIAHWVAINAKK